MHLANNSEYLINDLYYTQQQYKSLSLYQFFLLHSASQNYSILLQFYDTDYLLNSASQIYSVLLQFYHTDYLLILYPQ